MILKVVVEFWVLRKSPLKKGYYVETPDWETGSPLGPNTYNSLPDLCCNKNDI